MEFKKSKAGAFDTFVENADTQVESKPKKKSQYDAYLQTKMPKQLKLKIKKQIKGVYSLAQFIKNSLISDIEHFSNLNILQIYQKSMLEKTTMRSFVRAKLGLDKNMERLNALPSDNADVNNLIVISKSEKETIEEIARSLGVSCLQYSKIKMIATYELSDIFNFDELMELRAEAKKYELELDDFINLRLK